MVSANLLYSLCCGGPSNAESTATTLDTTNLVEDIMTPDVEPDSLSPHDAEVETASKMEDEIVQAFENEEEETDQGHIVLLIRDF